MSSPMEGSQEQAANRQQDQPGQETNNDGNQNQQTSIERASSGVAQISSLTGIGSAQFDAQKADRNEADNYGANSQNQTNQNQPQAAVEKSNQSSDESTRQNPYSVAHGSEPLIRRQDTPIDGAARHQGSQGDTAANEQQREARRSMGDQQKFTKQGQDQGLQDYNMMNETQRFLASIQPEYGAQGHSNMENQLSISPPRLEMDVIFDDREIQDPKMSIYDMEPNQQQQFKDGGINLQMDQCENDKRFYSLEELAQMEASFEKKFSAYRDQTQNNQHVLLSPQEYRAKFYWLDQENRWIDIGTGRFRILLSKDGIEHYIQIVSEDIMDEQSRVPPDMLDDPMVGDEAQIETRPLDSTQSGDQKTPKQVILHRSFIGTLQEFSRQGDTIITWQDDFKNEFAISFQEEKGAVNTWWSICFMKGMQINSASDENKSECEINDQTDPGIIEEEISIPTKDNLAELVNELLVNDPFSRRTVADAVMKRIKQVVQEQDIVYGKTRGDDQSDHLSDTEPKKLQTWRSLYLDKTQKIFNEVEDAYFKATKAQEQHEGDEHDRYIYIQQQVSNLHSLFQIYRALLSLNQAELLQVLLNENYYMTTFGALEYDPEVFHPTNGGYGADASSPQGVNASEVGQYSPTHLKNDSANDSRLASPRSSVRTLGGDFDHLQTNNQSSDQTASYRDFLQNQVKFKRAVQIDDPSIIAYIHLSYKLQYLKDTAMARFIDETTNQTIMQLMASMHQNILDYVFADDFERIQNELLTKMRDNTNIEEKESALKFFLEICSLLKSVQLTSRILLHTINSFNKIMTVLAETFNIMLPDKATLKAQMMGQTEELLRIYELRSQQEDDKQVSSQEPSWECKSDKLLCQRINPSVDIAREYLKNPCPNEDFRMTQIDLLKSNSIEIFYNLLLLQNNINNQNMRAFLTSEFQKQYNYVFLRHLAKHMIYSSQMGIKVSICEFFKDLISKETSEMQKNFQNIILECVVSKFLSFLVEDDDLAPSDRALGDGEPRQDVEMKTEEERKSFGAVETDSKKYKRQLDHSRILILQFLYKLIQDNVDPHHIRVFFVSNKVMQKVAACQRFNSSQINVEIIKFFKAIIMVKDNTAIMYMIKKDLFEQILHIFLNNKIKGNLLHSCILNLFEMMIPQDNKMDQVGGSIIGLVQSPFAENKHLMDQRLLNKLCKRLSDQGYAKTVFFNKLYEQDFKKFNRHFKDFLKTIQDSETESKRNSDRNSSERKDLPGDLNLQEEIEEGLLEGINAMKPEQDDARQAQNSKESESMANNIKKAPDTMPPPQNSPDSEEKKQGADEEQKEKQPGVMSPSPKEHMPKVTQLSPNQARSRSMSPNNPLQHDIDGYAIGSKIPVAALNSHSPKLDKILTGPGQAVRGHRKRGNSQEHFHEVSSQSSNPDLDEIFFNQTGSQNRPFPTAMMMQEKLEKSPHLPRSSSGKGDRKKMKYERRRAISEDPGKRQAIQKQGSGELSVSQVSRTAVIHERAQYPEQVTMLDEQQSNEDPIEIGVKRQRHNFEQKDSIGSPGKLFGAKFSQAFGPEPQKRQKLSEHKTPVLEAFNSAGSETEQLEPSRRKSIDLRKQDTICQEPDQDPDSKEQSPTNADNHEPRKDKDL